MKNKISKKMISVIIMAVMCITLLSFGASAISLDTKGSITLTILDKENKAPISGAIFRAYLFAHVYEDDDSVFFVYTDEFKNNGMDMGDFTDAYLPVHLRFYAESKALSYTEKKTDSKGRVVFDNLTCGAYLVVPVGVTDGYLNPAPFVVTVPTVDESQGKLIYDIDASPKVEADKENSHEKTYMSVKKQWLSTEKTPDSITVSLIKDGVIYDTVVLSAVNNWYHKWENLDKNHSWSVVETDVPDGYTVSYVTSQMTVIITNTDNDYEDETTTRPDETTTKDESTTVTESTTGSDDTTTTIGTTLPDDATTTPDDVTTTVGTTHTDDTTKPVGTTKPTGTTESTTKPEELIKTGQLNWPVPIFTIVGLLLFSTGWAMLNLGKKEEEIV